MLLDRVELAKEIFIAFMTGYDLNTNEVLARSSFESADAFIAEATKQHEQSAEVFKPFEAVLVESDIAGTKGMIMARNGSGLYRFETATDPDNHNFSYWLWVDEGQFKRIDPQPVEAETETSCEYA